MNNLLPPPAVETVPHGAELFKAASLMRAAMNDGRVKINPDGTFNLDGIPLFAPVLGTDGSLPMVETKAVNKFLFNGNTWTLQFQSELVLELPDLLGLRYCAQLIKRPYMDIYSTSLVTRAYGESEEIMDAKHLLESGVAICDDDVDEISGDVNVQVVTTEFRDEILPDENRAFVFGLLEKEYKLLSTLEGKGAAAEVLLQKEKIKRDIQKVEKYLAKHRYKGKNSCFDSRAERDRKSVSKAIKEAIKKIAKQHPALAEHLRKSINYGIYCSYEPALVHQWEVAQRCLPVATTE